MFRKLFVFCNPSFQVSIAGETASQWLSFSTHKVSQELEKEKNYLFSSSQAFRSSSDSAPFLSAITSPSLMRRIVGIDITWYV